MDIYPLRARRAGLESLKLAMPHRWRWRLLHSGPHLHSPLFFTSVLGLISMLATGLSVALWRRTRRQTRHLAHRLARLRALRRDVRGRDALTRLPNHGELARRLTACMTQVQAQRSSFALVLIGLDGFQSVNDDFGLKAGDAVLVAHATRMRAALREDDCLARVTGDVFAVVAPITQCADAAQLSQRLLALASQPVRLAGQDVVMTASMGIALFPRDADSAGALLFCAESAMHHSKQLGRATYRFHQPALSRTRQQTQGMTQELRAALARQELVLHYQPKYAAPRGQIIGAEALIRWVHPRLGLLPPSRFIPLAEANGMIIDIGRWVVDQACQQSRRWIDEGYRDWTVAINLSTLQFRHDDLVDTVASALRRHRLPARSLTVEITESTAMHDVTASIRTIERLAALGVTISLDDFGTGHSSLLYLSRLPATELKIDRGFVDQIEHGTVGTTIVTAIIAMASTLGMRVVAEGVETEKQKRELARLGCHAFQGFLLGSPVPASQFVPEYAGGAIM